MAKFTITKIDRLEKQIIRNAVRLAVEYWPNSHLGDYTRRQDMHSAFKMIRSWEPEVGLLPAAYQVGNDAYRHMDM